MDLAEIPKGHWLLPFKDRIRAFSISSKGYFTVTMLLSMDEIELDLSFERAEMLGITEMEIETPVEDTGQSFLCQTLRHTGAMIVTLTAKYDRQPPSQQVVNNFSLLIQ